MAEPPPLDAAYPVGSSACCSRYVCFKHSVLAGRSEQLPSGTIDVALTTNAQRLALDISPRDLESALSEKRENKIGHVSDNEGKSSTRIR
ncbi:protein of unknown function (plasmid) [Cupriavidus taiwanensis]|uniref:Uncharacterized protein n=1 Tax=Cupriavidus taiwanensis TaxID=164546 RepID=A0A375FJQ2_9BURK|nr:protein of unknown function [Cupriavidus taiwanensis]SOZ74855.1 protein of unknown function [Cupriavidus taiwanensis]SPA57460.1 protein of unknown function [Cupriavidus taiwanensis]